VGANDLLAGFFGGVLPASSPHSIDRKGVYPALQWTAMGVARIISLDSPAHRARL